MYFPSTFPIVHGTQILLLRSIRLMCLSHNTPPPVEMAMSLIAFVKFGLDLTFYDLAEAATEDLARVTRFLVLYGAFRRLF